jgi:hypothetical protein
MKTTSATFATTSRPATRGPIRQGPLSDATVQSSRPSVERA